MVHFFFTQLLAHIWSCIALCACQPVFTQSKQEALQCSGNENRSGEMRTEAKEEGRGERS